MMRTWIVRVTAVVLTVGAVTGAGGALAASGGAAACRASALRATYTMVFGSNATGHVEYLLTVVNRSHSACTLGEPVALTLLGARGQALPTHPIYEPGGSYRVTLAAGQWAQAESELSPDLAGPGEPTRGNCEPPAHALRIAVGAASVRAPMDPTPVCQKGAIAFRRLRAVRITRPCAAGSLAATFHRQFPPFAGFADYDLTLRNLTATACHVNSVVGLTLLGAAGRGLSTRVTAGISSPYVIPAHTTQTAAARVATRGGACDASAVRVAVRPIGRGRVTAAVTPPVAACRGGLIQLSTLFLNG
jgi:Protein of unknown function (DUF4232)